MNKGQHIGLIHDERNDGMLKNLFMCYLYNSQKKYPWCSALSFIDNEIVFKQFKKRYHNDENFRKRIYE